VVASSSLQQQRLVLLTDVAGKDFVLSFCRQSIKLVFDVSLLLLLFALSCMTKTTMMLMIMTMILLYFVFRLYDNNCGIISFWYTGFHCYRYFIAVPQVSTTVNVCMIKY